MRAYHSDKRNGLHTPSASEAVDEGSTFDKLLMTRLESLVTGKRRVMRNERLFRKADRLEMLYVVRFGQFKLIGNDSTGLQRVVEFYMAGDWMGLEAIANGHHNFGVIALEDSEVLEISLSRAVQEMRDEPQLQQQFFKVLSTAISNTYINSLQVHASLESRFARFLCRLGEKYERLGYSSKSYRLGMMKADIGCYLGTTPASISRLITRLNARGIITIIGRNVEVHDGVALDALANGGDIERSGLRLR